MLYFTSVILRLLNQLQGENPLHIFMFLFVFALDNAFVVLVGHANTCRVVIEL